MIAIQGFAAPVTGANVGTMTAPTGDASLFGSLLDDAMRAARAFAIGTTDGNQTLGDRGVEVPLDDLRADDDASSLPTMMELIAIAMRIAPPTGSDAPPIVASNVTDALSGVGTISAANIRVAAMAALIDGRSDGSGTFNLARIGETLATLGEFLDTAASALGVGTRQLMGGSAEIDASGQIDAASDVPTIRADLLSEFIATFLALVARESVTLPGTRPGAPDDGTAASAFGAKAIEGGANAMPRGWVETTLVVAIMARTGDVAASFAALGIDPSGSETDAPVIGADSASGTALSSDDLTVLTWRMLDQTGVASDDGESTDVEIRNEFAEAGRVEDRAEAGDQSDAMAATERVATLAVRLATELAASAPIISFASQPAVNGARPVATAAQVLAALADAGDKAALRSASGSARLTVQLEPETLGRVTIDIARTATGVTATIVASSQEAASAIERDSGLIRRALQNIGISVDRIDVATNGAGGFEAATDEGTTAFRIAGSTPRANGSSAIGGERPMMRSADAQAQNAAATSDTPDLPAWLREARPGSAPNADVEGLARAARAFDSSDRIGASGESANEIVAIADAPMAEVNRSTGLPSGSQVTATQSSTIAADVAPAPDAARLATEIADQASLFASQSRSEFQMRLQPDALGRLHVRLSVSEGSVTVRLVAETAQAASSIEAGLGQLRQSFQEHGMRVDRFDVVVSPQPFDQSNQHPRRSRGWFEESTGTRRREDDEAFVGALAAAIRPLDALA
ncbi:MAG: hypothetical protein EPO26_05610 [Chloroflexota bacterium]|nr:MAG: hypothetical protein EPO26_05610 [Chloroflexota bacterium]